MIFVHGLTGDPVDTWSSDGVTEQEGPYWPRWLVTDLPHLNFYTLGFPASLFAQWAKKEMNLFQRAKNVLELLAAYGFGSRPIVFVCHSLGGLLVKQILRTAKESTEDAWHIYCSNYKAMNDPMEGYYLAAFSADRHRYAASLMQEKKRGRGLACFSETHDNDLLWAHYASNWSGICIEYDYSELSASIRELEAANLFPVIYSSDLITIDDRDLIDAEEAVDRILRQKKQCWSYEREWRLLANLGPNMIGPLTITRIFLGSRIAKDHKRQLMQNVADAGMTTEFMQMNVSGYDQEWILTDEIPTD